MHEEMCHFTIAAILVKILFAHRHMYRRYEQAPKWPKSEDTILDILSSKWTWRLPFVFSFYFFFYLFRDRNTLVRVGVVKVSVDLLLSITVCQLSGLDSQIFSYCI